MSLSFIEKKIKGLHNMKNGFPPRGICRFVLLESRHEAANGRLRRACSHRRLVARNPCRGEIPIEVDRRRPRDFRVCGLPEEDTWAVTLQRTDSLTTSTSTTGGSIELSFSNSKCEY